MNTFSINEAFKRGWAVFKQHKGLLIGCTIVFIVLGGTGGSNRIHHHYFSLPGIILTLVFFILSLLIKIGFFKVTLNLEDGKPASWQDMFKYPQLLWKCFLVYLCYGIMLVVGFLLFIIPGFYILLRYCFAPLIVVDTQRSFGFAFKESARLTKGIKWELLGFFIALILINILGACLLLIGLLVSIPVSVLAFVHVYRTLSKAPQS